MAEEYTEKKDIPALVGVIVIAKDGDNYIARDRDSGDYMFTTNSRISAQGIASCCAACLHAIPVGLVAPFANTHIEWVGELEETQDAS